MYLTEADVGLVRCPRCLGGLRFDGTVERGALGRGTLACVACGHRWPVRDGLPHLVEDARVVGSDRFLRPIYDLIAPFHDAAVEIVLPLVQFPDAGATRDRYIARLELDGLASRDGRPLRILEVGVGGGANLSLIEAALPPDLDVELWGVDLSLGMIRQCRRRLAWFPTRNRVRLMLADAHMLPFGPATFDRVFHVGGINGYRDVVRGLAEMARVARGGTPIVVVDEALDPGRAHGFLHWLAFRAITFWDDDPRAPVDEVPVGARDVAVTPVSRFYYCLRFRTPDGTGAAEPPPRAPVAARAATRGKQIMPKVTDILTPVELAQVVSDYDVDVMDGILAGTLPAEYPPSKGWIQAISDAFYGPLPDDTDPPPREQLSLRDRERCTIALLATTSLEFELALHVYVALANEVTPGEIAHILMLAGIYGGIERFASGLDVEIGVLSTLKKILDPNGTGTITGTADPVTVVGRLRARYDG